MVLHNAMHEDMHGCGGEINSCFLSLKVYLIDDILSINMDKYTNYLVYELERIASR
jgi:hypothetical protein